MSPTDGVRIRGLATLALLKVYLDTGRDHIDMFLPFALDTTRADRLDGFSLAELKSAVLARHGLDIPAPALSTILRRAVRRSLLRRDAGRYWPIPSAPVTLDISGARAGIEREHFALAENLRGFAFAHGLELPTIESTLDLLLGFLQEYHAIILVDRDLSQGISSPEILSRKETRVVARFIQHVYATDPLLTGYVERMVEGLVLRNTLLLSELGSAPRRFKDLEVFFDTGFVFQALGLAEEPVKSVAREAIGLLRDTGARLSVFTVTIDEMRRVLRVYEEHLKTLTGIRSLRHTPLTRYFLKRAYTSTDVTIAISLLERDITDLGITIKRLPRRQAPYTLDEQTLSDRLRRTEETDLEPRVMHDVDCVAAVLTFRAGNHPDSLDDARAVFATTTTLVVRNVTGWYRDSGELGVPPVVHQLALSNYAWIKKPHTSARLQLRELVALCFAALQPSRRVWDSVKRELRKLEESGRITSKEEVAILASDLLESRLVEIDEDVDVDATTVSEVVEQVKAAHQEELSTALAEAEQRLQVQEAATERADTRAHGEAEARRRQELRVMGRTRIVARCLSWTAFLVASALVVIGSVLGLPNMFPEARASRLIGWVILGVFIILGLIDLVWGRALVDLRRLAEARLERSIGSWLLGPGRSTGRENISH